jgi:3-hydroxy-9,10-secoandrosta-1,3,5(10)-triene-9,17-dione monooxygenase reductase component
MDRLLDSRSFRAVMGAFPTGVAVLTARGQDGAVVGMTVNSLTSVSLDPLQVLVCLNQTCESHDIVLSTRAFALSLLPASAERLSMQFARSTMRERFTEVSWRVESTGSPVLDDAIAWLDCSVAAVHSAGDHTIVVAEVIACGSRTGTPLVFHRGTYTRVLESAAEPA